MPSRTDRFGFGNEVNTIKEAWSQGGAMAATAAVAPRLLNKPVMSAILPAKSIG